MAKINWIKRVIESRRRRWERFIIQVFKTFVDVPRGVLLCWQNRYILPRPNPTQYVQHIMFN